MVLSLEGQDRGGRGVLEQRREKLENREIIYATLCIYPASSCFFGFIGDWCGVVWVQREQTLVHIQQNKRITANLGGTMNLRVLGGFF